MDYKGLGMESFILSCKLCLFLSYFRRFGYMNSITIKDKHYILVNSKNRSTRCEDCDLHNYLCDGLCYTMTILCGLNRCTNYVFKELKVER